MKSADRLALLRSAHPSTPGTYHCPMPDCKHKQNGNGSGFCPTHDIPLRLLKAVKE